MSGQYKSIKISWVAPNGAYYQDQIPMTLDEYVKFVQSLQTLKQERSMVQ